MEVPQPSVKAGVFVYGSLLFDEVVECLTGKSFRAEEAKLADHARYAVRQKYRVARGPAMIYEPGQVVEGRLLWDIDSDTLRILDRFECGDGGLSRYERVPVFVTLRTGEMVPAQTYRAVAGTRPFLCGDWSGEDFKARHLEFYIKEWIPSLRQEWGMS